MENGVTLIYALIQFILLFMEIVNNFYIKQGHLSVLALSFKYFTRLLSLLLFINLPLLWQLIVIVYFITGTATM